MVRSKRSKVVSLGKIRKNHGARRQKKNVWRESVKDDVLEVISDKKKFVYMFELSLQRNRLLKVVREELKPGRVYYGRSKTILSGLREIDVVKNDEGLKEFFSYLKGERGLIVTNQEPGELKVIIERLKFHEYARAGAIATETVILKESENILTSYPHSIEPEFRRLGVPTLLKEGKIVLMGDFIVCKEGQTLSTEQAQLLKHLGYKMSWFSVKLISFWNNGKHTPLIVRE